MLVLITRTYAAAHKPMGITGVLVIARSSEIHLILAESHKSQNNRVFCHS